MSKLIILAMIFFLPMAVAWFMYEHPNGLEEKKLNYGELISPPFSIDQLSLYNRQGKLIDPQKMVQGKWTLLLLNTDVCDDHCVKKIFFLNQIRQALGKNRYRVQPIILSYLNTPASPLLQRVKNMRLLFTHKIQFQTLIHHHINRRKASQSGAVFIVDPKGNVILSYDGDKDPLSIYKDLSRLLKFSQIG